MAKKRPQKKQKKDEKKTPDISPGELSLRFIRLENCNVERFREVTLPLSEDGLLNVKVAHHVHENMLDYIVGFQLTQNEKNQPAFRIAANYRVSFEFLSELNEDLLDVFGSKAVTHITWPYARNFTHSIGSQMGIPGIIFPLYHHMKLEKQPG